MITKKIILLSAGLLSTYAGYTQAGNDTSLKVRKGLPFFFDKVKRHSTVTIGYLGGSITLAPGYRIFTQQYLQNKWRGSRFRDINAGVGGTGSDLGAFRVKNDVLIHHPDLVFIEFAVNDANKDSLSICNALEGIIRQIKINNPRTDICLLYSVNEQMLAAYKANRVYQSVRYMELVANYYHIPSINFAYSVLDNLKNGRFVFKPTTDTSSKDKSIFTIDGTHPTISGHQLYSRLLNYSLDKISLLAGKRSYHLPSALFKDNLTNTNFLKANSSSFKRNFIAYRDSITDRFNLELPGLICLQNENDSLELKVYGHTFGVEDIIGPYSSTYSITIDGQARLIQRFDKYCAGSRRSYFLIDLGKNGLHHIIIKLLPNYKYKNQIITTSQMPDNPLFNTSKAYLGYVMWR